MRVVGVIPARLQSSRLPRKLLLEETGRPLIQYVWEAASKVRELDELIVATDSEEIAVAVRKFGGRVELTGEHPSGSDRVAEVIHRCTPDAEIVVNIQGDEPEISPEPIAELIRTLQNHPDSEMATLATPLRTLEEIHDPSCVKVVTDHSGRALYFSRAMIPHCRDDNPAELLNQVSETENLSDAPWKLHLGLYAYQKEFLMQLTQTPPSQLELLEKLEQLRALSMGATIRVATVAHRAVGIDTPEDYARFVARCAQQPRIDAKIAN